MSAISADVRAWIVPGRVGAVALVDGGGGLHLTRTWVARLLADSETLELYVERSTATGLIEALLQPRQVTVNLTDPPTYRSRTFKGTCALGPEEADPAVLRESLDAMGTVCAGIGLPADICDRQLSHLEQPIRMVALRLTVDGVFDQSPKPGAGARL